MGGCAPRLIETDEKRTGFGPGFQSSRTSSFVAPWFRCISFRRWLSLQILRIFHDSGPNPWQALSKNEAYLNGVYAGLLGRMYRFDVCNAHFWDKKRVFEFV
jgi:hypothetical protein